MEEELRPVQNALNKLARKNKITVCRGGV